MIKPIQIAIDGPVAAGKSTIAKKLAERLSLTYIDTGAMYRAVALAAQQQGVNLSDEKALAELTKTARITLAQPRGSKKDGRSVTVYLNGQDVSWAIRTAEIGEGASVVSQYPKVRKLLVKRQRQLADQKPVVMEGRDIGSRVLPNATLKIYMTASVEERVKRKRAALKKINQTIPISEVKRGLMRRDNRERTRQTDPLRPTKDSWRLITTSLTIGEVVEKICQKVNTLEK